MDLMSIWAPVVAALGASVLTLFGSFGLSEHQSRVRERAHRVQERSAAYGALLAKSLDLVMRVQATDALMRLRSGVGDSAAIGFHVERFSITNYIDWIDRAFRPMYEAWSQVWAVGSQDAVNAANLLVMASNDLVRTSMAPDQKSGWLRSVVSGESWTEEQRSTLRQAMRRVTKERVAFAAVMRAETGREPVELYPQRVKPTVSDDQNLLDALRQSSSSEA
jgi:hypothetical protein